MSFLDSLEAQFNRPTTLEAFRNRSSVPGIGGSGPVISNLADDPQVRYAANVARQLAKRTAPIDEPVLGSIADPEARHAASAALRLRTPAESSAEPVVAGDSADAEAKYAANAALGLRRLAAMQIKASPMGSAAGGSTNQVMAPVADSARSPAPPMVTGPTMDAVQLAISDAAPGYRPGVTPDFYGVGGPERIESPPAPSDPSRHPAVLKRRAMGPKGVVPGAVPGGVPMEIAGTPPPPAPELVNMAAEVLPARSVTAREAAALQPTMEVAPMRVAPHDFSTGPLPWQDPAFIRWQHGLRDEPPPPVPQAGHGFLAHLKGLMEGLGAGMATGHPLAGAIMGVAGGVKPQLGANAWYNNVTLPRWQGQQDQALDRAAKRLAIDKEIAQITGKDPETGEPTYGAQQAQERSDQQERFAAALESHRKQMEGIARQHEQDMLEVRRGNLDIKQALKDEKMRMDQVTENLRKALLKIEQQNADANTMRANKLGQPRRTARRTASATPGRPRSAGQRKPVPQPQSGTQPQAATQSKTITPEQYTNQVQKYSADPFTSTADGKARVDEWLRRHGYEVPEQ